MMKTAGYISLVVIVAVLAFVAGSSRTGQPPGAAQQQQKILYYACPMHPQYHSDRAGDCPSCGMRLEPVYAEGAGERRRGPPAVRRCRRGRSRSAPSASKRSASAWAWPRRCRARVRCGRRAASRANENATYPLVSGVDARVRDVRSPTVGTLVRKNEVAGVALRARVAGQHVRVT